jgi:glycosyltransferase involved in cell wall biosynthesis
MNALASLDISVVIPIYNEADSIEELRAEIDHVMITSCSSYEIIFVDDGSTDRTPEVLERLHHRHQRVRAVRFRRNQGKSAALDAGFRRARGRIVITMDGDLQDDPAEIPTLLERLDEGDDVVSGWKQNRQDTGTKRLASRIFNAAIRRTLHVSLHDINCGFKAYRREVIDHLRVYGDLHRFLPALAQADGFRIGEVPVHHRARRFGKSRYGLERYLRGFFDLITVLMLTRYRRRPLHFFGRAALWTLGIGVIATIIFLVSMASDAVRLGVVVPLICALLALTLFGSTAVFVAAGLIGELLVASSPPDSEAAVEGELG